MAHHTAEEKIKVAELICTNYALGEYTLVSCAENQSIAIKTFQEWRSESAEIAQLYSEAKRKCKEVRRKKLKTTALGAIQKLIEGHTFDELHQEVEPIYNEEGEEIGTKTIKMKRVKKYYPPNASAAMFVLRALDPQTYRDALPAAHSEKQTYLIGGKEIEF